MGVRGAGGVFDFRVRRIGAGVADVLGNRRREQKRLLLHRRDLPAQRSLGHVREGMAVNADFAAVGVPEAGDQRKNRAFARA